MASPADRQGAEAGTDSRPSGSDSTMSASLSPPSPQGTRSESGSTREGPARAGATAADATERDGPAAGADDGKYFFKAEALVAMIGVVAAIIANASWTAWLTPPGASRIQQSWACEYPAFLCFWFCNGVAFVLAVAAALVVTLLPVFSGHKQTDKTRLGEQTANWGMSFLGLATVFFLAAFVSGGLVASNVVAPDPSCANICCGDAGVVCSEGGWEYMRIPQSNLSFVRSQAGRPPAKGDWQVDIAVLRTRLDSRIASLNGLTTAALQEAECWFFVPALDTDYGLQDASGQTCNGSLQRSFTTYFVNPGAPQATNPNPKTLYSRGPVASLSLIMQQFFLAPLGRQWGTLKLSDLGVCQPRVSNTTAEIVSLCVGNELSYFRGSLAECMWLRVAILDGLTSLASLCQSTTEVERTAEQKALLTASASENNLGVLGTCLSSMRYLCKPVTDEQNTTCDDIRLRDKSFANSSVLCDIGSVDFHGKQCKTGTALNTAGNKLTLDGLQFEANQGQVFVGTSPVQPTMASMVVAWSVLGIAGLAMLVFLCLCIVSGRSFKTFHTPAASFVSGAMHACKQRAAVLQRRLSRAPSSRAGPTTQANGVLADPMGSRPTTDFLSGQTTPPHTPRTPMPVSDGLPSAPPPREERSGS